MVDKVNVTLRVTRASDRLLNQLGSILVPGVKLSRGDVLDYAVMALANDRGLDLVAMAEALGDGQVETTEECNG
jgi:hypothetical protein